MVAVEDERALHGTLRAAACAGPRRLGGLMPLDPASDLARAGFVTTRRPMLPRGGYPSVVLRGRVRGMAPRSRLTAPTSPSATA